MGKRTVYLYEDPFLKSRLFQSEFCDWCHGHGAVRVMVVLQHVFQGGIWEIQ